MTVVATAGTTLLHMLLQYLSCSSSVAALVVAAVALLAAVAAQAQACCLSSFACCCGFHLPCCLSWCWLATLACSILAGNSLGKPAACWPATAWVSLQHVGRQQLACFSRQPCLGWRQHLRRQWCLGELLHSCSSGQCICGWAAAGLLHLAAASAWQQHVPEAPLASAAAPCPAAAHWLHNAGLLTCDGWLYSGGWLHTGGLLHCGW